MTNLWAFLLQTLTVSAAAVLLLAVKGLFADKLSPRWQYGVWCLLALRVLLPVSTGRDTLLPLPVWVEAARAAAEGHLSSAYSAPYAPVSVAAPVPWLTAVPQSVTDWLFVLYTAGVVLSLLWYALSYVRLRRLLRFGLPLTEELERQLEDVCQRYGLTACPALRLEGLSSAFVCGVFRPVLVLPANREVDDKVLLHELLHLRHRDALQNVFWCLLRGLHWCNPFLQYVFDRIGNDMEALCDQRVLERLEGEDRRAYGQILLSMADETYARAPGTTSLSNGGKNIARRIAVIVRFKKYPRGMALVSVCIAAVLSGPVLVGTASGYTGTDTAPVSDAALALSMARTRLVGCSTVAGALDTYAKGLLLENGIYLAAASPLERQEELETAMAESGGTYLLYPGEELAEAEPSLGYSVCGLTRTEGGYQADLLFATAEDEDGEETAYILVPVTVHQEDRGWVVEETGQRQTGVAEGNLPAARYEASGESGSVTLSACVFCEVDNDISATDDVSVFWSSNAAFDETLKPDAAFDAVEARLTLTYTYPEDGPIQTVGVLYGPSPITDESEEMLGDLLALMDEEEGVSAYGGSSGGWSMEAQTLSQLEGTLCSSGVLTLEGADALPEAFCVQTCWDGGVQELLTLEEVEQ
ncbi:MAG: M56 family metallopeptidase [Clostridiales bacterium]|nr:M56 family metallopeptidase [Clostridiales bacterium]